MGDVEAIEGRGNCIPRHPQRQCGDAKGQVGGGAVVGFGRVAETLKGELGVRLPFRCGSEIGTVLSCSRFPLLFLELLAELRDFQSQVDRISVLHSGCASQQDFGIDGASSTILCNHT